MNENTFILLYKLRFFLGFILIVSCMLLLSFILSVISANNKVQAKDNSYAAASTAISLDDNPNIIAVGMDNLMNNMSQATISAEQGLNSSLQVVSATVVTTATHSGSFLAHGVSSGATVAAHGVSSSFGLIVRTPGNILGKISGAPSVSSIIKPAEADHSPVPTISGGTNASLAAHHSTPAAKPSNQAASISDAGTQWPIHGTITTQFGVPELPYQAIHTGLDISDGKYAGITPIRAFKPGQVVQVIHSKAGLGNHVVIDHGGGVTSVYGHLNSTSVQVGQTVDKNTVIGYEGTTGASTGPHLHFEIRVNGQPVNPHQFISGQP
jgi:hypothetical protein